MAPARPILDKLKTNEKAEGEFGWLRPGPSQTNSTRTKRQKENSDGSGPDHLRQTEHGRTKAEGEFGWLLPGPS